MRVLFLTKGDITVASARLWFYQMQDYFLSSGIEASINKFEYKSYDIIFINRLVPELLRKAILHSRAAKIGYLAPTTPKFKWMMKEIDFIFLSSFLLKEDFISYNKPIYRTFDHFNCYTEEIKQHSNKQKLILGYHGNLIHYAHDFFPNLSGALQKLAKKYDFTLKVILKNPEKAPRIKGVETQFIKWNINTYEKHLKSFDIGLCPSFKTLSQLKKSFTYVRNANRTFLLLKYGIPSVSSPLPESMHFLQHYTNTLFAVKLNGWYDSIEKLMLSTELRNKIGQNGFKMVKENFSTQKISQEMLKIFILESKKETKLRNTKNIKLKFQLTILLQRILKFPKDLKYQLQKIFL